MRKLCKSARLPVQLLALGVFMISSQPAFAVRLVRFEILVDGKVVLETSTGDHGEDADFTWRHLKKLTLRPVKGYTVDADNEDPLRAALKGKVTVRSVYAGRAEVSELKLVREKEDAPWKIAEAEVERTFKSRHKPFAFQVSIDGKPSLFTVLQTRTENARDTPANVWQYLKRLPFYSANRYQVQPEGDDPLHATLKGKVIIELFYGGTPWERAEVSELSLVRQKVRDFQWKIDPEDVDRTSKNRKKPD